jgi:hypothetical protein
LAAGTQHVVEYEEETRVHLALTYDHDGAVGAWRPGELASPVLAENALLRQQLIVLQRQVKCRGRTRIWN